MANGLSRGRILIAREFFEEHFCWINKWLVEGGSHLICILVGSGGMGVGPGSLHDSAIVFRPWRGRYVSLAYAGFLVDWFFVLEEDLT